MWSLPQRLVQWRSQMPAQFNIKLICAEYNGGKYRVSENECQGDRSSLGGGAVGEGFVSPAT